MYPLAVSVKGVLLAREGLDLADEGVACLAAFGLTGEGGVESSRVFVS